MERQTHTIDATGKALGRIAVQVANLLRGKMKPSFLPYKDEGDFVVVKNIKEVKFTGKKMDQKKFYRHSGFSSGLHETSLKQLFETRPEEVLKITVSGMLPKNKLRKGFLKRLKVE